MTDLYSFPFEVAQCLPLWECLLSLPPDAADYGQIAAEYPFSERDIRAAHGWIIGARTSPSYPSWPASFQPLFAIKTRHARKAISRKAARRMRRRYA